MSDMASYSVALATLIGCIVQYATGNPIAALIGAACGAVLPYMLSFGAKE